MSVLSGPLRPAVGPSDWEGLGRERFWDMTDKQRTDALRRIVADSCLGAGFAETKEFARGWLSEHARHKRAR